MPEDESVPEQATAADARNYRATAAPEFWYLRLNMDRNKAFESIWHNRDWGILSIREIGQVCFEAGMAQQSGGGLTASDDALTRPELQAIRDRASVVYRDVDLHSHADTVRWVNAASKLAYAADCMDAMMARSEAKTERESEQSCGGRCNG